LGSALDFFGSIRAGLSITSLALFSPQKIRATTLARKSSHKTTTVAGIHKAITIYLKILSILLIIKKIMISFGIDIYSSTPYFQLVVLKQINGEDSFCQLPTANY
jgi:hypothetical protein